MKLGPAAAQLVALAIVEPLHFASFYARTRLYRGGLQAAPAEVVLDLTQDCPLDCAFCLAGAVRGGGRRIELPQLRELAEQLHGIPRMTVVGGEPLAYPQLRAALELLRQTAGEVEIITGGATLPLESDKFRQWAETHLRGGPGRLVLTLSVDHWHRQAVGEAAFARRVEHLLQLETENIDGLQVRFLATDPRLHTAGYVQREVVEGVLRDLHPGLAERWLQRFAQKRAGEVFRFGPVVRLGSAQDSNAEPLEAGELSMAGEVVLTPRGEAGALLELRALPATWMNKVPSGLQRATFAAGQLAQAVEQGVVAETLGFDRAPELCSKWQSFLQNPQPGPLARELRTAAAEHLADNWPSMRSKWLKQQAVRLHATCATELPWTFAVDRPWRRVHLPLLRELWALRVSKSVDFAGQFQVELVAATWRALGTEPGWPAFVGYTPQLGLLCERPDAPIDLAEVPLDIGVATPYLGDAWHTPRLVLRAGFEPPAGHPVLCWDGLGSVAWQPGDAERAQHGFGELGRRVLQAAPEALREAVWVAWRAQAEAQVNLWQNMGLHDLAAALQRAVAVAPAVAPEPIESRAEALRLVAGPRVEGW